MCIRIGKTCKWKCYLLITHWCVYWFDRIHFSLFFFDFNPNHFQPFVHINLWLCFVCNIVFDVQWVPHFALFMVVFVSSAIDDKRKKNIKKKNLKWLKYVKMWKHIDICSHIANIYMPDILLYLNIYFFDE